MKRCLLVLLFGICLLHWITAAPARHETYHPIINNGTLENVTITVNSSDIDLSCLQIEFIEPRALDALTYIKTLDLSNNSLSILPSLIFSKLTNLEELSLANNRISSSSRAFTGLNHLKRLDLSNNFINDLADNLKGLPKSTEVIIERNNIRNIAIKVPHESVVFAPAYEDLDLFRLGEENCNKTMPQNFQVKLCKTDDGTVRSLEELKQYKTLSNCIKVKLHHSERVIRLNDLGIKKFERGWYKLSVDFIRSIDLSNNEITDIEPEFLNDLPVDMLFDLSFNNISIIRRNIIANEHCVGLHLYGQRDVLQTIEDGAFENVCISLLHTGHNSLNNLNYIRTIPSTIEFLELPLNGISEIPSNTFQGFKNLRALDLSSNNLEIIESGTFDGLDKLFHIGLHGNKITRLNSELFKGLPNIAGIWLEFNKITKITKDIFSGLRSSHSLTFYLSHNEIDTIEEGSFSHLNISYLDLYHNRITDESIANGAFNMCRLKTLELQDNSIMHLNGDSFSGILGSYHLELVDNPLKSVQNFPW